MADLGSVGRVVNTQVPIRSRRAQIATGMARSGSLSGDAGAPDFLIVSTPVPSAGINAMVFVGPGTRTWQVPVAAGAVTVSVKMLKRAGYGSEQLPYLELAAEGATARDTMADVTDTWDTLSATLTPSRDGVLKATVTRPWPTYGSNFSNVFLSASNERRLVSAGNLYVADFVVS